MIHYKIETSDLDREQKYFKYEELVHQLEIDLLQMGYYIDYDDNLGYIGLLDASEIEWQKVTNV